MKVKVDPSLCCSYQECSRICPEVFKHDQDGVVYVDQEWVPSELEGRVEEAASACPQGAIMVQVD